MKNIVVLFYAMIIAPSLSAQNVGIGTNAPSGKLSIEQTGTTPALRINIDNASALTPGVFVVSNASGGGIEALNTHATAKINSVTGYVNSNAAGSLDNGVTGVWGVAGPATSGIYSAGVRGVSHSNINSYGVIGYHTNGGIGVLGISSATGVQGTSFGNSGGFYGVDAQASNGATALHARYQGGKGKAIQVDNGSVSVAGVNRFVFEHKAVALNISGNYTVIDHPFCNGESDAMLIVTHQYRSSDAAVTLTSPVGVRYDSGTSRWRIYLESGAAMPANSLFNVLVINQ